MSAPQEQRRNGAVHLTELAVNATPRCRFRDRCTQKGACFDYAPGLKRAASTALWPAALISLACAGALVLVSGEQAQARPSLTDASILHFVITPAIHLGLIALFVLLIVALLDAVVTRGRWQLAKDLAVKYTGEAMSSITNRKAFVNPDRRFAQEPSNRGYVMYYDVRDTDLKIEGQIPAGLAWNISAHSFPNRDRLWGGAFLNQDTVTREPNDRYSVILTTRPKGRTNELDVSESPAGSVILRYTLMRQPELVEKFAPRLTPVPREST